MLSTTSGNLKNTLKCLLTQDQITLHGHEYKKICRMKDTFD